MAAENNPFYVRPPNVFDALLAGTAGYDRAQKTVNDNEIKAARQDAFNALQQNGDLRGAMGKLLSVGDDKGAAVFANFGHQQATEKLAAATLANTQQNQRAQLDLSNRTLENTIQHQGADLGFRKEQATRSQGNVDRDFTFKQSEVDRTQKNTDRNFQLAQDKANQQEDKTPSGFRQKETGDLEPIPGGPADPAYIKSKTGGTLDPYIRETAARQDIRGDKSWMTNLGRGTQGSANIADVLNEKGRILRDEMGYSPERAAATVAKNLQDYKAESSGKMQEQRTLGGMEAKMGAAGFEAEGAIKLARPVVDKVPRTSFLPFNKLIQGYQNQTLNPDQVELYTRIQGVINTYAAVMSRGANISTVHAQDRAEKLLNTAGNSTTMNRVFDTMQSEINMARNSPQQMRDFYKKQYGQDGVAPSQNLSDQGAAVVGTPQNVPAGADWKTYFGARQ